MDLGQVKQGFCLFLHICQFFKLKHAKGSAKLLKNLHICLKIDKKYFLSAPCQFLVSNLTIYYSKYILTRVLSLPWFRFAVFFAWRCCNIISRLKFLGIILNSKKILLCTGSIMSLLIRFILFFFLFVFGNCLGTEFAHAWSINLSFWTFLCSIESL